MEVEDVTARELLARFDILTADDADAVGAFELFLGRVGESLVHVVRDAPVADKVGHARSEGADGEVQVAHDVQRQSVVRADEHEEGEVHEHVEEIGYQFEVEQVDSLVVPPAAQAQIVDVQRVLGESGAHSRRQD